MACEECADLTTHDFRNGADLVHAVQTAAQELDRGVLRRIEVTELTAAEREALQSVWDAGASPQTMKMLFQCTVCGDRFELSGDSEAGTGYWKRGEG